MAWGTNDKEWRLPREPKKGFDEKAYAREKLGGYISKLREDINSRTIMVLGGNDRGLAGLIGYSDEIGSEADVAKLFEDYMKSDAGEPNGFIIKRCQMGYSGQEYPMSAGEGLIIATDEVGTLNSEVDRKVVGVAIEFGKWLKAHKTTK
jgi:hypothetical protein